MNDCVRAPTSSDGDARPRERATTRIVTHLDKSYPAAPSDPLDGIVACSVIFFTRSASSPRIVAIGLFVVVVVVVGLGLANEGRRNNARAMERVVVRTRVAVVAEDARCGVRHCMNEFVRRRRTRRTDADRGTNDTTRRDTKHWSRAPSVEE